MVKKNKSGVYGKTIKGGIFFLIPLVIVTVVIGKVFLFLKPISHFLVEATGLESSYFSVPFFLTVSLILICSFLAGLIATSKIGKSIVEWIENNILVVFSGYQLIKSNIEAKAGMENSLGKNYPVVLVPIDGWMFAFNVDTLKTGEYVVFVPGAPSPWEGNVIIFEPEMVKATNYSQGAVIDIMRQLGINTSKTLKKNIKK